MEEFDFTRRVTSANAKHDKISLLVKSWHVRLKDVGAFRSNLAIPPPAERTPAENDVFGWLFGQSSEDNRLGKIPIRRSEVNPFYLRGRPLFGGEMYFTDEGPDDSSSATVIPQPHWYKLALRLDLNPTRYIRHLACRPTHDNAEHEFRRLLSAPVHPLVNGEFALGGAENDNWLPTGQDSSPETQSLRTSEYIRDAIRAVQSELERTCSKAEPRGESTQLQNPNHYALKEVETYWEFASNEAITRVAQMGRLLDAPRSRHTTYVEKDALGENARCLRFEPKNGVMVRIYAKTPKRIRFEVVHDFRMRDGRRQSFLPCGTVDSVERFLETLEELRVLAASEVNAFLESLDSMAQVSPYSPSVITFLYEFSRVVSDAEVGHTLLSLLAANKRIVKGNKSPLGGAIDALKAAGLLVNTKRVYMASPPYRHAVLMLSSESLNARIFIRRRRPVFLRRTRPSSETVISES